MLNNYAFCTRPSYTNIRLQKVQTPKNKMQISADQVMKTQPDERTTAHNMKKKMDTYSNLDTNLVLESRLYHIEQLIQSLRPQKNLELQKILKSLFEISKTLKAVSRTEIDLNQRNKQLEIATLENLQQKQAIQKMKEQHIHIKQDYQDFATKLNFNQQDQSKLKKELMQQKRINEEQFKKIRALEKRIEMILERNLQTHQDELRITLGGLINENEQLKRDLLKKEKEIERLKELNSKLVQQTQKLTKKLDSLKTKKVGLKQDILIQEEDENEFNYAFDPNSLPNNLDYRLTTLQNSEIDFLMDLVEHGAEVFTTQVLSLDSQQQKKDLINLVSNQFVSARIFSEKINSIMNEFIIMVSYKNIQDFQIHISKAFKTIFNVEIIRLWIVDGMTCRAETYDNQGIHHVALLTEGVFSEIVFGTYGIKSPQKEQQLLYITEYDQIYGENCLILPIMGNSKKPCGILEIQNLQEKNTLDAQYFGLLINILSKSVIQSILDYEALQKELKYKDIYNQCFMILSQAKGQVEFSHFVQECAFKLFQVAQTLFLYVENGHFILQDGRYYQLEAGCSYNVYKTKCPQIFGNITKHPNFDENVDISSILPIFCAPIIKDDNVVAILQFLLKRKRFQIDSHPFGNQANIGFKISSVDQEAQQFYEMVQKAYLIAFQNNINPQNG